MEVLPVRSRDSRRQAAGDSKADGIVTGFTALPLHRPQRAAQIRELHQSCNAPKAPAARNDGDIVVDTSPAGVVVEVLPRLWTAKEPASPVQTPDIVASGRALDPELASPTVKHVKHDKQDPGLRGVLVVDVPDHPEQFWAECADAATWKQVPPASTVVVSASRDKLLQPGACLLSSDPVCELVLDAREDLVVNMVGALLEATRARALVVGPATSIASVAMRLMSSSRMRAGGREFAVFLESSRTSPNLLVKFMPNGEVLLVGSKAGAAGLGVCSMRWDDVEASLLDAALVSAES